MMSKLYFLLGKLKSNFRLLSIISFICLSTNTAFAQGETVTGVITGSDDELLPGANIIEKGTTNGTTSDFDGNYTIKVSNGAILVISYIGYETKEILVGNQTTIDVALKANNTLDEVVVIGYGTKRKSDLTGAIASVGTKDFDKQPLTRTEDALQSRVAGVSVLKNSGAPGGDIKIRVRGTNSISQNNDPLIVIDGVIGGELRNLNSVDIQSIDVLKDASATAIYGSRGANGVVLVTTKKGKSGKPQIHINYFISSSQLPKKIDLLSPSQFADLAGTTVSNGGADYQDEYFRTTITNNLQVSASGREGKINYYLSGNFMDQNGIIINTDYERYALRSNLNADLTDKLSVGLNLYGSREGFHNLVKGGSGASTDVRGGVTGVLAFDPALPVRDSNGNYNLQSNFGSILVNPIAVQNERDGNLVDDSFNANLNLSYDVTDALNYTLIAGSSSSNVNNEVYNGIPAGSSVEPPSAGFSSAREKNYQLSNILTWEKDLGNTNLKVTGIYELQSSETKLASFSSSNFAIEGLSEAFYLLELGQNQSVGANQIKSSIQSYVLRAEAKIAEKLFVTGTIRVDESSRFRDGNRTGYFPSLSAAYKFNKIKLRAGYGETGNQNIPALSTYSQLNLGNNFYFDGSSFDVGLSSGGLVDENLKWETTKQFNVGADVNLANGRLNLSLDWFKKNTTDLLLKVPVATHNGGGTILQNIGEVQNTGFDVSLAAVVFDTDNFSWDSSLTLSSVKNKVIDLGGAEQIFAGDYHIIEKGESLGNFYGFTYTGADANRNATYQDELGVIGNGTPDFTWGLNNTLTYKNFDFNVLFRGVHGYDVLNVTRGKISLPVGDVTAPTSVDILKSDSPTGGVNQLNSTRYIEDGSFIRLSNLSIGYTLPEVKGFQTLKIYISGQNLFTITNYTGYDPEVSSRVNNNLSSNSNSGASDALASVDFGAIPNPRTFTLGVNISF